MNIAELTRATNTLKKRVVDLEIGLKAVSARYSTKAAQSIPDGQLTIINYDTKVFDDNMAVHIGASWKFTAPTPGTYAVKASVLFAGTTGWADLEIAELIIRKNAQDYSMLDWKDNNDSASSILIKLAGIDLVRMKTGDYLDIRIYQNSGAALALSNTAFSNYVSIWKI